MNGNYPEPRAPVDPAPVREQLERILQSAPFRNSRRYPALLRYVVEHTLDGKTDVLKERTIAADVFGRPANYDPSNDPVVRTSAAEVRKRLAQYYQEANHSAEIRIEVPLGSYVPEFHEPQSAPPPGIPARATHKVRSLAIAAAILAVAAAAWLLLRQQPSTALDQFWKPVLSSGNNVTLCVGRSPLPPGVDPELRAAGGVGIAWPDVQTLARLAGFVQSRGRSFQLSREDQATFADLQQAPAVLVGAFNDGWTLRLMQDLRFQFRQEGPRSWIADRNDVQSRRWQVDLSRAAASGRMEVNQDYAIVSRVANTRTGRFTVMVAGLWGYGTQAAGVFLTDPQYLRSLAAQFPSHWQDRNMQFVIGTEVIDGSSGPPRVLAMHFW